MIYIYNKLPNFIAVYNLLNIKIILSLSNFKYILNTIFTFKYNLQ